MNISLGQIRVWLFYILIFTLPWQTRWIIGDAYLGGEVWEYGRVSLYSWDILLVALVLLSWPLLWLDIKNVINSFKQNVAGNNLVGIYFLLLTLSLVSIFWSIDKELPMVWFLRLVEAGGLWLLVKVLKPQWLVVCWALLSAGTIQALWAIGQFLTQSTFANKWLGVAVHPLSQGGTSVVLTEAGRWLRAYAGQVHPNVLGGLLVITCLATIYLYIEKRVNGNSSSRFGELFLLLLLVIQLSGLFFTFSRGAWLALATALVIWLVKVASDRRHIINVILLAGVALAILSSIFWQPVWGRVVRTSQLEQQSFDDRATSIKESSTLLSTAWWRGVGMGNYTLALAEHQPGLKAWRYQPVHNIFLLIMTELGIVGLIFWVIIFIKSFFSNWVWLAPVLVISLFDHYWWTTPSMFLLFWLIIAVVQEAKLLNWTRS